MRPKIVDSGTAPPSPFWVVEPGPGHFVYGIPDALPRDVCREMIRRSEEKPDQQYPGRIGNAASEAAEVRKSTDIYICGRGDWKDIDKQLRQSLGTALHKVTKEFPFFAVNRFKDIGYSLQRCRPGEFYQWHIDSGPGGETEFALQGVKVIPNEGKLVLFPPFWTHIHRAVEMQKGVK